MYFLSPHRDQMRLAGCPHARPLAILGDDNLCRTSPEGKNVQRVRYPSLVVGEFFERGGADSACAGGAVLGPQPAGVRGLFGQQSIEFIRTRFNLRARCPVNARGSDLDQGCCNDGNQCEYGHPLAHSVGESKAHGIIGHFSAMREEPDAGDPVKQCRTHKPEYLRR
jgi:hypothetical protein